MVENLRAAGWEIEPPAEQRDDDAPVGRPHLARAVLEHPANAERLRAEQLTTPGRRPRRLPAPRHPRVQPAPHADRPRGGRGDPRRRRPRRLGAPVLGRRGPARRSSTRSPGSRPSGFDGVEVFYTAHSAEQTRIAYDAARAHGLLTTGSADFHGPGHEQFNRFRAFELHGLEPVLGPLAS